MTKSHFDDGAGARPIPPPVPLDEFAASNAIEVCEAYLESIEIQTAEAAAKTAESAVATARAANSPRATELAEQSVQVAKAKVATELRKKLATKYRFRWHGEPDDSPLKEWLADKMLPKVGKAIVAGQWGTYKTFAALDLSASVMTKTPFAGRAVNRQGGVLFIAAEGQNEIRVRIEGLAREKVAPLSRRGGVAPVDPAHMPFVWLENTPLLTSDSASEELCALAAWAHEMLGERFGLPLAMVVIDTLMPAAGFKDANDASEVQRVMRALTDVAQAAQVLVLVVDHFGKNVDTGTRNSSVKEDAADAVLALLADRAIGGAVTNPRLAVRKVRGAPTGQEIPFSVREVTVYENASYDAVTTLVVDWSKQTAEREKAEPARAKAWPKSLLVFKKALNYALTSSGKRMRPFIDGPEVLAAEREAVRAEFMKTYEADNADAKRAAFSRSVKAALAAELMNAREIGDAEAAATFLWPLVQP